jgi:hypothetical protein
MAEINWSLAQTDPTAQQARAYNYADHIAQAATTRQAGQKYASGDYKGAASDLASSGDIPGAIQIQSVQNQQEDRTAKSTEAVRDYVGKALPIFQHILEAHQADPDGGSGAIGQAFDSIAPELASLTGHNPEIIAGMRQRLVSSPKETLDGLAAQLPATYEKVGNTIVRRQGDTVKPVYTGTPDAPSGFTYQQDGKTLAPIPGGPGDPSYKKQIKEDARAIIVNNPIPQQAAPGNGLKQSIQLRKEFDQLPDVKDFHDVANSYDIIADIARKPATAQNDLSLIFAYMKMLDPGSVVREGEFANAQNTAGVPDQIRNLYNRARTGQRLNPDQRSEFTNTAGGVYSSRKRRYDQLVNQYQGYARDSGLGDNVIQARIPAGDGGAGASESIPTVKSPEEAMKLKPGTKFKTPDGRVKVR